MDYDVLILGGGLVGCAAAYELSKYSLNIALIERAYDIAYDLSQINAAMVYDGSECADTLMAFDNGINFKLEEEVVDIKKNTKGFKVITNKNKFTCAMVINTTPVRNY